MIAPTNDQGSVYVVEARNLPKPPGKNAQYQRIRSKSGSDVALSPAAKRWQDAAIILLRGERNRQGIFMSLLPGDLFCVSILTTLYCVPGKYEMDADAPLALAVDAAAIAFCFNDRQVMCAVGTKRHVEKDEHCSLTVVMKLTDAAGWDRTAYSLRLHGLFTMEE